MCKKRKLHKSLEEKNKNLSLTELKPTPNGTQHSNPGQGRTRTARFEVQYTKHQATVPPTNLNPSETVAFGPQVAFEAVALNPDVHTIKQPEALLHSLPFSLSLRKLCSSFSEY